MKRKVAALVVLLFACSTSSTADDVTKKRDQDDSPFNRVYNMMTELLDSIRKEGLEAEIQYRELSDLCHAKFFRSDLQIKAEKEQITELSAEIAQEHAVNTSLLTKTATLRGDMATQAHKLKEATEIRAEEAENYAKDMKALDDIIHKMQRALTIVESKGSVLQLKMTNVKSVAKALEVMAQASVLTSADTDRLTELMQTAQAAKQASKNGDDDDDLDEDEPLSKNAYDDSRKDPIMETLSDMLDKAEEQKDDAQRREAVAIFNYDRIRDALKQDMAFKKKALADALKDINENDGKEALAQGDRAQTESNLDVDEKTFDLTKKDCLDADDAYESKSTQQKAEMRALQSGIDAIQDVTKGRSVHLTQVSSSFLQLKVEASHQNMIERDFMVVKFVRDLARKEHAPALNQLAMRMANAVRRNSGHGKNPFTKVKKIILDVLDRLDKDQKALSRRQVFCENEIGMNKVSKSEKEDKLDILMTKLDQAKIDIVEYRRDVGDLQDSLAKMELEHAKETKLRNDERELYQSSKREKKNGLESTKKALEVLRGYYSEDDSGSGGAILSLLEVIQADLTQDLAAMDSEEENAKKDYDESERQFFEDSTSKRADLKYKEREVSQLSVVIKEIETDGRSVKTELKAVNDYLSKMRKQCAAEPGGLKGKIEKLDRKLAGLKEAQRLLEGGSHGDSSFLQVSSSRRLLRGTTLN